MVTKLTQSDYVSALKNVGLSEGDIVYVHSQLYSLGHPNVGRNRAAYCQFFIDGIRDVVGPAGTIVIPSMSTQVGRTSEAYDPSLTPSNYGTLPEYAALHPEFVRSLHPLISISAQGPHAVDICGERSTHNFNVFSPFERLVRLGAKNLFLGVSLAKSAQINHYAEYVFGVPYFYNKIMSKRPHQDGSPGSHLTCAAVRYLTTNTAQNLHASEQALLNSGVCSEATLGNGSIICAPLEDMVRVICSELEQDPFFLLEETPVFPYGDPPMDGLQGRPPVIIRDSALSGEPSAELLLARAKSVSPQLAEYLKPVLQNTQPSELKHLDGFSLASWREFAWSIGEVSSPASDAIDDVLSTFLVPHLWQAHNFNLGYFHAPLSDSRYRSLVVGKATAFDTALTKRFSPIDRSIRLEAAPLDSDEPALKNLGKASDVIIRDDPNRSSSFECKCEVAGTVLEQGGMACFDLELTTSKLDGLSRREIIDQISPALGSKGLKLERTHRHRDNLRYRFVLRKAA
ncbi:MAG: AAC(3) family N-acetyltransferase [Rhizobiaceae bacterium]